MKRSHVHTKAIAYSRITVDHPDDWKSEQVQEAVEFRFIELEPGPSGIGFIEDVRPPIGGYVTEVISIGAADAIDQADLELK